MPEAANLSKAELRRLDSEFKEEIEPGAWCKVQFNPESLKVSFANQLIQPPGPGDQRGTASRQFVGAGTTKLALTLWFDVGSPQSPDAGPVDDVRKLTEKVAFFITPAPVAGRPDTFAPPAVRFVWGSFQFDGLMDSLEETLEYFSPEGKPLRASLALALSQQRIQFAFNASAAGAAAAGATGAAATPGTQPLAQAPAGATLQSLADAAGRSGWQSIAAGNGIENPRLLAAGQLVDLNAQAPQLGASFGVQAAFAVSAPASIGTGVPASIRVGG